MTEKQKKQEIQKGKNEERRQRKEKTTQRKEKTGESGHEAKPRENLREEKVTFSIDKEKNFSEWFTEIIKCAELADVRYNVKGFVVFREWSVLAMEAMYWHMEKALQRRGHMPVFFPSVIPEKNFQMEKEHVSGFAPEVFWVTEHGAGGKLEERLALRPTSETAFYQMYSLWVRSYKDLPLKLYQRAQVWRYETKATRPFLRGREFHWIEAHDVFATPEEAEAQVREDMQTTEGVFHGICCVPFIFFKRPEWDKFAGAVSTYAADSMMPNGRLIQQPSTHLLGQNFSKPFNVKFTDRDGKEKYAYITCYGPAISRMFASVVAVHGDNKGLRFPFEIAPLQVVVVPIAADKNKAVIEAAKKLAVELFESGLRVRADLSENSPGDKFYFWEMKGVPLRIELGPKELAENRLTIYRRDTGSRETIPKTKLEDYIKKTSKEISNNLRMQADKKFQGIIKDAKTLEDVRKAAVSGGVARTNFCSDTKASEKCAEVVEKNLGARVCGTRVDRDEKPFGDCVVCGKKATKVVYIGGEY